MRGLGNRWMHAVVLLVVVSGVGAACGIAPSQGTKFDPTAVKQIQKCVTTRDQLVQSMGKPYRKGIVGGQDQWTWYYVPGGMVTVGADLAKNQQLLVVAFNGEGQVLDYIYNPPGGVIWKPEDACVKQ